MKKVGIVGVNKQNIKNLALHLKEHGLKVVKTNPEFVISLGGDGTYLYSERLYPNVPKLMIRDSNICKKCHVNTLFEIEDKLVSNDFVIKEYMKLEAKIGKKKLICANDFVMRNKVLTQAIRFEIFVDGKRLNKEMIGDGLVISTPFGSTAYYYSMCRKKFSKGIGIAFNNLTNNQKPVIINENSTIKIKLLRESAHFARDNDPKILSLKQGDEIIIKRSKEKAKIITMKMPRSKVPYGRRVSFDN